MEPLNEPAPPEARPEPQPEPVGDDPAPKLKGKKAARPLREWETPEALAAYDSVTITEVNELVADVDVARDEFTTKREDAKEAKREWEAKRDVLLAYVKERKAGRGKPEQKTLLDYDPVAHGPVPVPPAPLLTEGPPLTPDPIDELWRRYPLERFNIRGMTDRDIEILAAGERKGGAATIPCRTVGELANYTAGDGTVPRHITDFRGLGAAGATRIDAALELFWGWWNGGGRDEYAAEVGVKRADHAPESGGGAEVDGPAGGDGDGPSEPDAPAGGGPAE